MGYLNFYYTTLDLLGKWPDFVACSRNIIYRFFHLNVSDDTHDQFSGWNAKSGMHNSHAFSQPGIYQVTLIVTDNDGLTSQATQTITVKAKPQASISGDYQSLEGQAITFDARSSSDIDGEIVGYQWSITNSVAILDGETPTYTFEQAGIYLVT